ncbi:MAG: hypothetical protein ACI9LO_002786 [Planctomycetota bacterium]|jgi:hypothetical protein
MTESSTILLDGRSDCKAAAEALILGAVQRVYLFTQRLEAELYNNAEIHQHLKQLATVNRKTDIRIISHDTRVAANQGHYLINLAQSLPSFAQILITATREHQKFRESWLIVDEGAYMRIRNPDRYEGYYELDNKLECRSYRDTFLEYWDAAVPDNNTRRLTL